MTTPSTRDDSAPVVLTVSESLSLFQTALDLAGWQRTSAGRYARNGYCLATGYGCGEVTVSVYRLDPYKQIARYTGVDPLRTLIKHPHTVGLKELAAACYEVLDKHLSND